MAILPCTVVNNTMNSGAGSLRKAIECVNIENVPATISFDILPDDPNHNAGILTIAPTEVLPAIIPTSVTIDASTQPSVANRCGTTVDANGGITDRNLAIQLNGSGFPSGSSVAENGLIFAGASAVVRGISITNYKNYGIVLNDTSNDSIVSCSHLGTDVSGMIAGANGQSGFIAYGTGVTLGGADIGDRNVLSGNNDYGAYLGRLSTPSVGDVLVTGNYIGVGLDGMTAVPNAESGLLMYGGAHEVAGFNVISGNTKKGIFIGRVSQAGGGEGSKVSGAYIGVGGDGSTVVANAQTGIFGTHTNNITIGGTTAAERNVISGNETVGIQINDSTGGNATTPTINIITPFSTFKYWLDK